MRAIRSRPELAGLSEQARGYGAQAEATRGGHPSPGRLLDGIRLPGQQQLRRRRGSARRRFYADWTITDSGATRRRAAAQRQQERATLKRRRGQRRRHRAAGPHPMARPPAGPPPRPGRQAGDRPGRGEHQRHHRPIPPAAQHVYRGPRRRDPPRPVAEQLLQRRLRREPRGVPAPAARWGIYEPAKDLVGLGAAGNFTSASRAAGSRQRSNPGSSRDVA